MSDRTYILTLDEQQYQDIITAVEIFCRVSCGQVEELRSIGGPFRKIKEETLIDLKSQVFPELHPYESYGWSGGHENKNLDRLQAATYAIYREMLHKRTLANKHTYSSVYESSTLTTNKAKLPKIQIIDNNENNTN